MYLVDIDNKRLSALPTIPFSSEGLKERYDLQEWLAKNPECLCTNEDEDLLIIQKEFSSFDQTRERLDLLALDQDGNLVIIELKTDDSGRDTTWQAIKYASYCASLTKEQIIGIYADYLKTNVESAKEKLNQFFNNFDNLELNRDNSQRIILVAANFRPEVTSSVMWLISSGIKIRCIQIKLFKLRNDILFLAEQIIPTPSIEQYIIKIAAKNSENDAELAVQKTRRLAYQEFWTDFLESCKERNHFFSNLSPRTDNWISKGTGKSHVGIQIVITEKKSVVQLEITNPEKEFNKKIFDALKEDKKEIEAQLGLPLQWNRNDETKRSLITLNIEYSYLDKGKWPVLFQTLQEYTQKYDVIFKDRLANLPF